MKKKSLLILPVLLLALAACDNEEEEVVEETVPEATETETETESESEDTHTQPPVLEETEATESLGLFDFAALTAEDSDRYNELTLAAEADEEAQTEAVDDTVTPILAKAWKEPTADGNGVETFSDEEDAEDSVPWTVTSVTKVYSGANGDQSNAGNNYWQFSYQCLQFSSGSVNGSLTIEFDEEVEISEVKVSAIAWNANAATLDVVETPEVVDEGDGGDGGNDTGNGGEVGDQSEVEEETSTAQTITQSALDTTVTTPASYSWELGATDEEPEEGSGVNSITISATGRVLVFSITVITASTADGGAEE